MIVELTVWEKASQLITQQGKLAVPLCQVSKWDDSLSRLSEQNSKKRVATTFSLSQSLFR